MSDRERDQWRQELIRRQRNFVFPDTVRNEGNFLRGIVYNSGRLTPVQRIGAVVFGLASLFGASFLAALTVEDHDFGSLLWMSSALVSVLIWLLSFAVTFKLISAAIFPGKPPAREKERD